ncbi:hypothetical protein I79_021632 [Cricetulus griseus]|uniref:Uncharacterized protein n=1 Tax=Cricetulus griseus TaxID=10029 RepID=G3ID60_CRIGR|nr:hypothetical protein I79_021632 [Cricetulus griseus]
MDMIHTTPSTQEAETGRSLEFKASLVFWDNQGYIERPCLKIINELQFEMTGA